ncbi:Oligopeptide transport ATP-binding protein AppF [[Clostridium] ultunense Esp]|nr:Oligopeptide transport ATP-binding protein AppF [[Clostridium] ultunense Esp]
MAMIQPNLESKKIIEVDNLVVTFEVRGEKGKQTIIPVDHVSFSIHKGEVLSLVGESGSGKSTIGRTLVGINRPSSGTIRLNGQDVTNISGKSLREYRKNVQMIFQDPFGSLNPVKTVESHLMFPLKKHQGYRGKDLYQKIGELLYKVGLTPVNEIRVKYPYELSGGQRQRLAIARVLAVNPKFVIADEPISMLDVSIRAGILQLMNQLKEDFGLSYLYITHDLASARYFGDRIMVLYGGKVMEVAESKELIMKPLHPYTRLLLASTPGSQSNIDLTNYSNEPPNLSIERKGCPFAYRCPLVTNICREEMPPLKNKGRMVRHLVACHHSD